MAEVLNVKIREQCGKRRVRRMRSAGEVPAVLYGHGKENKVLAISNDEFSTAIRHGARVVDLKGELDEQALIRDVQWDTFGTHVLHVDFWRVEAGESVETSVAVTLRGEAPGAKDGGIVEQVVHEVSILCPVTSIPDKLEASLKRLELGGTITAADLTLPEGAELRVPETTVLVSCVIRGVEADEEEEEEAAAAAGPAEPEIIGRKAEEEAPED
jgi:large subunit ribosomal protein L25